MGSVVRRSLVHAVAMICMYVIEVQLRRWWWPWWPYRTFTYSKEDTWGGAEHMVATLLNLGLSYHRIRVGIAVAPREVQLVREWVR